MNYNTLAKVHKFGKVGRIAITVFLVLSILATAASCVATVFVASLPEDAVTVRVTNNTEFRVNEKSFPLFWDIVSDNFSYPADADPGEILMDENGEIVPPENQEFETQLDLLSSNSYKAKIHTDGNTKVMEAQSSPVEYRSGEFVKVVISLTLLLASIAVMLFMLRRMFGVLAVCDSPFCEDFVNKMRVFGYTLLPVALFDTVGETLSENFLSVGRDVDIRIQWGVLIAFAVTMCLVVVFRYGVQLQKESDETL